jgi:hypothetical protein
LHPGFLPSTQIVFSTNYDKLFDLASKGGFRLHPVTSTTVGDDLRLGEPVFLRLHGSTDVMNEVVLTRSDYAQIAKKGRDVFDALRGLSLTSTILFIGYSLEDPDIQLLLQEIGRPGTTPEAHFMLAPEPPSASRIEVFKESFGVSVLTYPAGQHSQVYPAIIELGDLVLGPRSPPPTPKQRCDNSSRLAATREHRAKLAAFERARTARPMLRPSSSITLRRRADRGGSGERQFRPAPARRSPDRSAHTGASLRALPWSP